MEITFHPESTTCTRQDHLAVVIVQIEPKGLLKKIFNAKSFVQQIVEKIEQ